MKKIYLLPILIVLLSCKEKKTEFIQSPILDPHFLLKNPPNKGSIYFYRYTSNTKPFLKDKRPGGYFREYLRHYPEDKIASYIITKCKNDSTKLVGELFFYGLRGSVSGMREIDTLIYHCK